MASEYPPLPYVCPLCHWSWATEPGMRVHIPVEHNTTLDRFDAWQEETTNAINYHVSVNERLTAQLAALLAERDAEVARLTRETECADTIIKANAEAIAELEAERDAALAREALLREALELELQDEINAVLRGGSALTAAKGQEYLDQSPYVRRLRAALAAGQGDGQG